jgi:TctA family transporter
MDTFWAYTATFLTFLGMWAAGKKIPWAWLPNIVAQLCWIAWVIHTEMWDVMLSSVVLILIYIRNSVEWKVQNESLLR